MSATPFLIHARGIALDSALDDVQLMPPGTHTITPTGPDGKPITLTVTVTEATAAALEAARAKYQAEADAQTGDAPYIDFNHDDGPAAAWVKSIYWAGDDPHTGGVRAKIEWSDAGREAIEGKLFRRFSPSFIVDPNTGAITSAPVNMGGLVNRAAFRTINAFFATAPATESQTPTHSTMTEEQIAALQAENETLKQRIAELEAALEAATKEKAEAEVEAAARDGRIPPAPEIKAKWVQTLLKNPDSRELLASLPVNPALETVIRAKAAPETDPNTPAALKAKYDAMPDGPAKDKFRRENAAALLIASRAAK